MTRVERFLYLLQADELPMGTIERLLRFVEERPTVEPTPEGLLATLVVDQARRLCAPEGG